MDNSVFTVEGGRYKIFKRGLVIDDDGVQYGKDRLAWADIKDVARKFEVQRGNGTTVTRLKLDLKSDSGKKLKIRAAVVGKGKQQSLFDAAEDVLNRIEPRIAELQWPRVRLEIAAGEFKIGRTTFTSDGLALKKGFVAWAEVEGSADIDGQRSFITTTGAMISQEDSFADNASISNDYIQRQLAEVHSASPSTSTSSLSPVQPAETVAEPPITKPSKAVPASGSGRAALGVLLIAGFFVFGILLVALSAGLLWLILEYSSRIPIAVIILPFVIAYAVIRAFIQLFRKAKLPDEGVPISLADHPELAEQIADIARLMDTPVPDEVRIVPDVNAYVAQESRLLGLLPGRRQMAIGVPLLSTLTVSEMRAVLAHEFGHYAGGDTRLSGLTYGGRMAMIRSIQSAKSTIASSLFEVYALFYIRFTNGVSRQQELAADRSAVKVGGRAATASALSRVEVNATHFQSFMALFVHPMWREGLNPVDLYSGFREMTAAHPEVSPEEVAATVRVEENPYDTHPTLPVRLAAINELDEPEAPDDRRLSRELLRNPELVEREVAALLARLNTGTELQPSDWETYLDMYVSSRHDYAAQTWTAVVAEAGNEQSLTWGSLLALASDRSQGSAWWRVTALVNPDLDRLQFRDQQGCVDSVAASGTAALAAIQLTEGLGATWHLNFSPGPTVRLADGSVLELGPAFAAALIDGEIDELWAKLATVGITSNSPVTAPVLSLP